LYSSQFGHIGLGGSIGALKSAQVVGEKIWIGTSHCLLKKDHIRAPAQKMLLSRTTAISTDSENNIWAGGLNGLFSEKDSFTFNWGKAFKPLSKRILSIQRLGQNKLAVATSNLGLLEVTVKDGAVTQVKILNDSLDTPIDNIQSVFVALDNTIWLSTNSGIYSLDSELKVHHYSEVNGLPSNNVNSVFVDVDTVWAATVEGLSRFLLKETTNSGAFKTCITSIKYTLGNNKIQRDLVTGLSTPQTVTLPPGAAMLEVEFTGLRYRTRGNLFYEYKTEETLMPLRYLTFPNIFKSIFNSPDKALITSPVRNFGLNITPGSYLTTVTALLPDGTRSASPDSVTITVLPYWWQTVWFLFLVVSAFILGLWRLLRVRENMLKMRSVNSELQLQAIRAQMNPHFVGNSINAIQQFFYPPDPVKASEYISIFSDLLRRTMYFSETDFISFVDELAYLDDYLKMIKLRFGNRFSYNIIGAAAIDKATLFPAMLLQPILENATIHGLSPNGPSNVEVEFYRKDERLFCTVTDNGVGIEASKARKLANPGNKRISKGISLLEKKVQTLNLLHPVELALETVDLSKLSEGAHGTKATISFRLLKDFSKGYSSVEQISKMP
jgi:two-component sensor histidine kinase